MGDRKLYVLLEFFDHRSTRLKELRRANKGAMVPLYPDWMI